MLRREPERRAARREDLQIGSAVEQLCDVDRSGREVLEVVEEEERAGARRGVSATASSTRWSAGLARADRTRDRARDELGVGDGCEPDEVHGPVERRARGHLEREPALAGAARAGDRDEPRRPARRGDSSTPSERVVASDEPVMKRRKARGGERLQRREVFAEPGRDELEELDRGGNVLQPMSPERSERTPRGAARLAESPALPA